jgi:hypothetical protein
MSKHWSLRHPTHSVVGAVVALTTGEREGAKTISLTLRQASGLLTHLRTALAAAFSGEPGLSLGKCAICSAGLSTDRALLVEAEKTLLHLQRCGECGEDSWNACGDGGQHAERTLAAIQAALAEPQSADAVDSHAQILESRERA